MTSIPYLNELSITVSSADEVSDLVVTITEQRQGCSGGIVVLILWQETIYCFDVLPLLYVAVDCLGVLPFLHSSNDNHLSYKCTHLASFV